MNTNRFPKDVRDWKAPGTAITQRWRSSRGSSEPLSKPTQYYNGDLFNMMMSQIMAQFQFGLQQLAAEYDKPVVPEPPDLYKRKKFQPDVERQRIKTKLEEERLRMMNSKESLAATVYTDLTDLLPPEIITG